MSMLRALGHRPDSVLIMLVLVLSALLMLHYGGSTPGVNVKSGQVLYHEPEEIESAPPDDIPKAGPPVRFLMYNVQNYFVTGETSRKVYLPAGEWKDYFSDTTYAGGWHEITTNNIPVFVKL